VADRGVAQVGDGDQVRVLADGRRVPGVGEVGHEVEASIPIRAGVDEMQDGALRRHDIDVKGAGASEYLEGRQDIGDLRAAEAGHDRGDAFGRVVGRGRQLTGIGRTLDRGSIAGDLAAEICEPDDQGREQEREDTGEREEQDTPAYVAWK